MKYLTSLVMATMLSTCASTTDKDCGSERPSLWPRLELNKPIYAPNPWRLPNSRDYFVPRLENLPFYPKPEPKVIMRIARR